MWSLPEIRILNAHARSCAGAYHTEANPPPQHQHKCECCGDKAEVHEKYFDIFSDDAKGVRHLCECCDDTGHGEEGYFRCDCCERLMVENYTWELYRVELDGQTLCLTCAAETYFGNTKKLIHPAKVKQVVVERGRPLFRAGVLNLAAAPHVLGVEQPLPEGIKFVENFEFDSHDGHQISGGNALATIRELRQPFFVALDAGWQFAISVGLYVRTPFHEIDGRQDQPAFVAPALAA